MARFKPIQTEKFKIKVIPSGINVNELVYHGVPAKEQGEFDDGVGVTDMACVNQFGQANN